MKRWEVGVVNLFYWMLVAFMTFGALMVGVICLSALLSLTFMILGV